MCGCMPPDELATAKQVVEVVALSAAPLGVAVSLVATVIGQTGPRLRLAVAMLGAAAALVILRLAEDSLDLGHRIEMVLYSLLWAGFIFLGLISLVYYPVRARWVNLPLVAGVGISLLGAVTHQSLMLWSSWLVLSP